jgi:uncharacterized protein (DUF433 family)
VLPCCKLPAKLNFLLENAGVFWSHTMDEQKLLERITINPHIYDGKPIVRGHRLAVEHVLGMLAAGDTIETILEGYPWLEVEDVRACLVYARRVVGHERIEPLLIESGQ